MTKHQALDLRMCDNDAQAKTIRQYFKLLLIRLIEEKEGFSGKHPFGNSGWAYDLYAPLIKANIITGEFDSDGFVERVNEEKADKLLIELIKLL